MLDCPNEGNNSNKRPKSFGSSMNDNITATCYKCQAVGHYSSGQCPVFWYRTYSAPHFPSLACPNGAKKAESIPTFSENIDGVECYKCGKPGHWSKSMYISY